MDNRAFRSAITTQTVAWISEGRQELFGLDLGEVAWAVGQALPAYGLPDLYTEVPLAGTPGTDIHVLTSHWNLRGAGDPFPGPFWEEHPQLLAWATQNLQHHEGMGVNYDLSKPNHGSPATYFAGRATTTYFSALGMDGMARLYDRRLERLPEGWRCWYRGCFANREGTPLRLGIILSREAQDSYVGNPSALEATLASVGVTGLGHQTLRFLSNQAAQPYPLDIEIDVLPDGTTGNTVGFNLTLGLAGDEARRALAKGSLRDVLMLAQQAGLADDRWHLLADAAIRIVSPGADGSKRSVTFENRLAYLKLRIRGDEPLDAKAYFLTAWGNR